LPVAHDDNRHGTRTAKRSSCRSRRNGKIAEGIKRKSKFSNESWARKVAAAACAKQKIFQK